MNNKEYLYHIVLVAPEIPQNTGNIGRICANTGCKLHLVKPISFSLDDRYVRRSGMDYWKHIEYEIHESWEDFLRTKEDHPMYFYSTKAKKSYWDSPMEDGSYLIFGSEGHGLPQNIHESYPESFYTIPMPGNFSRSLNLANSTAIVIYEGLRRKKDLLFPPA
ncbi:MAG: tRNA (cytidine(34)-2'-O)-methyltransferase [Lentisphaeria bacterium]|nr:tRNA (cytidine(34)-2'-O)-methyltransferase [Lentisphaeria bacterium]